MALGLEELGHSAHVQWSERAADRAVRRAVVAVSANLGNTPAVCRSSYINPRTFDLFRSGITIERAVIRAAGPGWESPDLGDPAEVARVVAELGGAPGIERAVLRMLKE